jgi:hypothetical protein
VKTCSKCGDPKDEGEFNKRTASKDGLAALCRLCQRAVNVDIYRRDRKEINEYRRAYQHQRRRRDVDFRLRHLLRTRITKVVVRGQKTGSAVRDLGCSFSEFKTHLEKRFYAHPITGEAMSWGNYGAWHVDHMRALARFDLADRAQFLQACHFTNLQPLWAEANWAKGAA